MSRDKPDVSIRWSKRERALLYTYQSNAGKAVGSVLSGILERITLGEMNGHLCGSECKRNGLSARLHRERLAEIASFGGAPDNSDKRTLAQDLDARGYDLATLRISIRKKTVTP